MRDLELGVRFIWIKRAGPDFSLHLLSKDTWVALCGHRFHPGEPMTSYRPVDNIARQNPIAMPGERYCASCVARRMDTLDAVEALLGYPQS